MDLDNYNTGIPVAIHLGSYLKYQKKKKSPNYWEGSPVDDSTWCLF